MKRSAGLSVAEQKSFAEEIERRVAQRTAELTATIEQLRKELAERKRTEEALREEELFKLIVESIPVPVAITSPTGEVEALNKPTLEYFGLGMNNRILKIDLLTSEKHEYVYVLDAINRGQGVCEILAINDHEFLVVERDNRSNLQTPPQAPTRKTIYKIDLNGATDVSGIESLPAGALPVGVVPVSKNLFINLLDTDLNLAPSIAEKIEGLAWGSDLEDGRHVLYVLSDNDLNPSLATQIYAFAIDPSLINFQEQILRGPLYPPGQVKKVLRQD